MMASSLDPGPTPRTAPGPLSRGVRRVLEGCEARLPLRPVGHVGARPAALRTTPSTRTGSQKRKGQHADAVEASKGQRKHHKGAA